MVQADHEKFCRRAKEVQAAKQDLRIEAPAAPSSEVASLYKKQDLRLKQGETLKCASLKLSAIAWSCSASPLSCEALMTHSTVMAATATWLSGNLRASATDASHAE